MQIQRTVLLLTAAFAAISLKAQVATAQVKIPIRTSVTVTSGVLFDRVVLSGFMNLTAQNNPSGTCQLQQPGGLCVISTLVDVYGTGQLTGLSYHADGASIFTVPPTPVARGGITFTGSYRLVADPLLIYWGLTELPNLTLPISVGLNSYGQMTSASVPSGGALWLGNDSSASPAMATDISGSILGAVSAPVSGIAFDGTNLWFSDPFGNLTKRTPDGNSVLASIPGSVVANNKDMAWDSKRQRLWRVVFSPPALERINPTTGTIETTIRLPTGTVNDPMYPRAAVGVAYNGESDRVYVSFCKEGCSTLGGVVTAFDAGTGTELGDLFSTSAYLIGGLAFDPATGNLYVGLWNGFNPVIANMTLKGAVNSSFSRGGPFVDGLELVGGASMQ
jgi:hypothetical protein